MSLSTSSPSPITSIPLVSPDAPFAPSLPYAPCHTLYIYAITILLLLPAYNYPSLNHVLSCLEAIGRNVMHMQCVVPIKKEKKRSETTYRPDRVVDVCIIALSPSLPPFPFPLILSFSLPFLECSNELSLDTWTWLWSNHFPAPLSRIFYLSLSPPLFSPFG